MRTEKIYQVLKDLKDVVSIIVDYDHYVLKGKTEILLDSKFWRVDCMINYKENQVIVSCYDIGLKIFDLTTNKIVAEIKLRDTIIHLDNLPNNFFVGGSLNGNIILWNDRFQEVFNAKLYDNPITFLNVIYTNKILIGSYKTINMLNSTGPCEKTFTRKPLQCNAILRTKDGDKAVTGYTNSQIEIWNPRTGITEVALIGHKRSVMSICILYEYRNNKIVSGSLDNTIRVWNIDGVCEKIYNFDYQIRTVGILQSYQIINCGVKNITVDNIKINDKIRSMLVLTSGKVLFWTDNGILKLIK